MSLIELAVVILLGMLMMASVLPSYIATKKRTLAQAIYAHLVSLYKALWNIDMILKANDSNLNIPKPNSCSASEVCNLICGAKPYLWKNLPDYQSVKDQLVDNFLDPRGRYKNIFSKFNAYAVYQYSGGNYIYTQICLQVGRDIGRMIVALDGGENTNLSGNTLCYRLNEGAGYTLTPKNYNCY
jgi:hypothetical protein